jgi:hypothetical protein
MKKLTILTSLLILFSIGLFTSCKDDDGPKILSEYLEAYTWDMYYENFETSTDLKSTAGEQEHWGTTTFKNGIMTIEYPTGNDYITFKFVYEVDDEHNTITIVDEVSQNVESLKSKLIGSKIFIKSASQSARDCDDSYDVDWTSSGKTMVWTNDCYSEKITFNAI